jgi:hypothetical protein
MGSPSFNKKLRRPGTGQGPWSRYNNSTISTAVLLALIGLVVLYPRFIAGPGGSGGGRRGPAPAVLVSYSYFEKDTMQVRWSD